MTKPTKPVSAHTHADARVNIPPGEMEAFMAPEDRDPVRVVYEKLMREGGRPELVWRGKFDAEGNDAPLEVPAPPIYLQEQVHPKALIEDLRAGRPQADDLFAHFGVADEDREAEIEFYSHPMRWSNRMILGDSLQVMASLAEREGLRGKVQCVYIDPPYGIRFNSNFQWSTTSRDVKDGNLEHLTREPEQVRAFRDTWRDGVHSYLSYLRDRLIAARDLLTESGSCFVQIGDENVHRVRALMDEVFGTENFVSLIPFKKTTGQTSDFIAGAVDYIIFYAKKHSLLKYRQLF
jgi:adenine-specific DNA-methyltransferase